jgi:hypothetical protein
MDCTLTHVDDTDMYRVLSVVEEMSATLAEAAQNLGKALRAIDAEMSNLEKRLSADAAKLEEALLRAELSEADRETLMAALARVEGTAAAVANFTHKRDGSMPPHHP